MIPAIVGQQKVKLSTNKLAKWATTIQMVALGFLLIGDFGYPFVPHALAIGQIGISVAAGLALITGWTYMKAGLLSVKALST